MARLDAGHDERVEWQYKTATTSTGDPQTMNLLSDIARYLIISGQGAPGRPGRGRGLLRWRRRAARIAS